jgi:hypothetical protein
MHRAPSSWNELPRTGATIVREQYVLEFKRQVDPKNRAELAKDVALLANMYGGTLLVGAVERPEGVEYVGLPAACAQTTQEAYSLAVRDFCSPHPIFAVHEIPDPNQPDVVVVAVCVEPYPDQPVGAAAPDAQGRPTDAWRFPIRVRSHATFARPDQLMLWFNPTTRRTAIALSEIGTDSTIRFFCDSQSHSGPRPYEGEARLTKWNVGENYVELQPTGNSNIGPFRAPLEDVTSASKGLDGVWQLRLRGSLVQGGQKLGYHPAR